MTAPRFIRRATGRLPAIDPTAAREHRNRNSGLCWRCYEQLAGSLRAQMEDVRFANGTAGRLGIHRAWIPVLVLNGRPGSTDGADGGATPGTDTFDVRCIELPAHTTRGHLALARADSVHESSQVDYDGQRILTTVLCTDIVSSTERLAALGDQQWQHLLDKHNRLIEEQLDLFKARFVKSTGDGVVAAFDGAARAVRCAVAISMGAHDLGIEVRAGLHTGECSIRTADIAGIAVHISARVAAIAAPGEVLVSSTVRDVVVGSDLPFVDRGVHTLKGVPGTWAVYAAVS